MAAGEEWCIGGDFNTVLFEEERIGKSIGSNGRDSANFYNFVEDMAFIDLPCVGGRFTWFSGNSCVMSRLDRFLITEAVEARSLAADDMWKKMEMKECFHRVKLGQNWLKEGDLNSMFFHNSLKERVHRNSFSLLETPNGRVEGVSEDSGRSIPVPDSIRFNRLEVDAVVRLEHPFEEGEIKAAVWDCDGCKTHGPNGYSLAFFKNHWELLKEDILNFVADFHSKAILTKSCTSTIITLVPKVMNPKSLSEYRPICLVGSLQKIISKLLVGRLKEVIDSLI
ncbi:uncharacterized protein LOC131640115 [Vicia villosa]|uniref:uncharacterized protein LOC131640115 n=1 Tax=Vicia villosa TaxID=3911 RepID=UPI00273C8E86|nr:uncharacterized protein LOC131640115 [Vicia villosa]